MNKVLAFLGVLLAAGGAVGQGLKFGTVQVNSGRLNDAACAGGSGVISVDLTAHSVGETPFAGLDLSCPRGLGGAGTHTGAIHCGNKSIAALVVEDFNGDGIPDAAVVGLSPNDVSILLGNSNGTFQAPANFPISGGAKASLLAGDFNGDGITDLLVATPGDFTTLGRLELLLGKGNGQFQPAVGLNNGKNPVSVALGDFNNDGKSDLAVLDQNSGGSQGSVLLLLGKGDGTFQPTLNFLVGPDPVSIVSTDFNGDGKPDLVVTYGNLVVITVLLGKGDGTFLNPVNTNGTGQGGSAYGDFNGDGKLDLAVVNGDRNTISISLGNGNGSFGTPSTYLVGSGPEGVQALDLNGDGKLDLLVNGADTQFTVLPGNGDGSFCAPQLYPVGSDPESVVAADFNGDGIPDLAAGNRGTGNVSVLLGSGSGAFLPAEAIDIGPGRNAASVATISLNGPKKPGLAVADSNSTKVVVLLPNPNGFFKPPVAYEAGASPSYVTTGVFNVFGHLDLVTVNLGSSALAPNGDISIISGNGDGTYGFTNHFAVGNHPVHLAVGDFNGDGFSDLAVVNTDGLLILLGKGNGTFHTPVSYQAGTNPNYVAVADLNGDGHQDLVVVTQANNFSSVLEVFLGKGDGTFGAGTSVATAAGPVAVAVQDFDRDGKLDLVVAHCCGNRDMTYLLGNGDGTFQPEVHFAAGPSPKSIAVADFDGDGWPDLAVADSGQGVNGGVSVLLNFTGPRDQFANVSAASFLPDAPLATDSIVAAFGSHLAAATASAQAIPLPIILAGSTVTVTDSTAAQTPAPLFFASPGQINYEIPPATASGPATITIKTGDGKTLTAHAQIVPVAPGLFTIPNANSLAAANVLRVRGNVQTVVPVTSAPIDLGPDTDQVFLILYGTGIRHWSTFGLSATIGGVSAPVTFAGPQGSFVGLDQVNIVLPHSLKGKGTADVALTVDALPANIVRVNIQ